MTYTPDSLRDIADCTPDSLRVLVQETKDILELEAGCIAHADAWEAERDTKGNFKALQRVRAENAALLKRLEERATFLNRCTGNYHYFGAGGRCWCGAARRLAGEEKP